MKEYGILYAKVCFPKEHRLNWLNYCGLFYFLPKDLQDELILFSNQINQKWNNGIIIPMDTLLQPGCVTTPSIVEEVAKDIFDGFNQMIEKLTGEKNCVRLVWGIGEMNEEIESEKSLHKVGYYPIVLKVGRFLDESNDPGMFKV